MKAAEELTSCRAYFEESLDRKLRRLQGFCGPSNQSAIPSVTATFAADQDTFGDSSWQKVRDEDETW